MLKIIATEKCIQYQVCYLLEKRGWYSKLFYYSAKFLMLDKVFIILRLRCVHLWNCKRLLLCINVDVQNLLERMSISETITERKILLCSKSVYRKALN